MDLHIPSLLASLLVVSLCFTALQCNAQAPPTPSPAPAPAPSFVNITQVLASAGQFNTFLSLLYSTKVAETFQNLANQTHIGITVFAPVDKAFSSPPASILLKNLTDQQKILIAQYHALPSFHPFPYLQTPQTALPTMATNTNGGGTYTVNVSDEGGSVYINTGWSRAEIVSTLYNAEPASLFAIDQVLLPEDIFGIPLPSPAPSPSAGSPDLSPSSSSSPSSPSNSGSGSSASGPSANSSFAGPSLLPSLQCFFLALVGYISLSISLL